MKALARLWRDHRALTLAFALATVLAAAFILRAAIGWERWSGLGDGPPVIEAWMTPGYIARTWDVPPEDLSEVLGIVAGEGRGRTLAAIAADRGIPFEDLRAALLARIAPPPADAPRAAAP